jgi:nitrite reductase/ring-hydroxylating ferredoxin subunit
MSATRKIQVATTSELPVGATKKFAFERDGARIEAFLANANGEICAYVNRCQHVPIPLDLDDNDFFTADGRFFVCKTHGSVYDPHSGKCIGGLGAGKFLEKLIVICEGDRIFVEISP